MALSFHSEDCNFLPRDRRKITKWIKGVVAAEGYKTQDVAYIFCSPEYHININRTYLHHDYNTDVITFDYSDLTGKGFVSGDIFIDQQTVRSNAVIVGTESAEELMRVIVHGVLHLCGHGDKTAAQEKAMRTLENRYLEVYRTEEGNFPKF